MSRTRRALRATGFTLFAVALFMAFVWTAENHPAWVLSGILVATLAALWASIYLHDDDPKEAP